MSYSVKRRVLGTGCAGHVQMHQWQKSGHAPLLDRRYSVLAFSACAVGRQSHGRADALGCRSWRASRQRSWSSAR